MTGNNKVWRAPLAGLASVAMIATMGVAAATANAVDENAKVAPYNFTVTLNAGDGTHGKFNIGGGTEKTIKTDDASSPIADGKFTELYESAYQVNGQNGNTFTGWYLGPEAGAEKFDFRNTFLNKDVTLYAHYAEPDDVVTFTWPVNEVTEQAYSLSATPSANSFFGATVDGSRQVLKVSKQDKKIAKWEIPSDVVNGRVVDSWRIGTGVSSSDSNDTVTFDQLATDFTGKLTAVDNNQNTTLDLTADKPAQVREAVPTKWTYRGGTTTVDVPYGAKFLDYAPSKETTYKDEGYVNAWTDEKGGALQAADTASESNADPANNTDGIWDFWSPTRAKAFKVTFFTEINGRDEAYASQIVDQGKSAEKAEPAARNKGSFAGYTTYVTVQDGPHSYVADEYKFGAVTAETSVVAQWAVDSVEVTYDYNYAGKTVKQSYKAGEQFTVPTATRDGYTLLGWYKTRISPAEFGYYAGKGWANGTNYLSHFAGDLIPLNAQLRINAAGTLEYQETVTDPADPSYGDGSHTTVKWTPIPSTLYAAWGKVDTNSLNEIENTLKPVFYVNHKDGDLKTAGDQKSFTADSFKKAIDDWQSYLTKKASFTVSGSDKGLTNDQSKELVSDLQKIQSELVFNRTKVVWRLINKESGRHQVTAGEGEFNYLRTHGWKSEAIAYKTVDEALLYKEATGSKTAPTVEQLNADPTVSALLTPVERLYNADQDRQHLVPANAKEMVLTQSGWNDEGPAFYKANNGTTPIYRMYIKNMNEHFWVAGVNEYNHYKNDPNFSLEGVGFYL